MGNRLLADLLVVAHLGFVLWVLVGALAVAWRPRLAWLHLPAVAWAVLVELNGWTCPLTPWEQQLRALAGSGGYAGGFVEHYVLPVLYPQGLTADIQKVLGTLVLALNAGAYSWLWRRTRAHRRERHTPVQRSVHTR